MRVDVLIRYWYQSHDGHNVPLEVLKLSISRWQLGSHTIKQSFNSHCPLSFVCFLPRRSELLGWGKRKKPIGILLEALSWTKVWSQLWGDVGMVSCSHATILWWLSSTHWSQRRGAYTQNIDFMTAIQQDLLLLDQFWAACLIEEAVCQQSMLISAWIICP